MSQRIRAGIIGLGRSGWNIHAKALEEHADYEVKAVADPLEDRRREAIERFDCRAYENPDELIEDEDLDMIVVASPSHLHVSQANAAMRAGKHVVVEKPMAQRAVEVDEMIAVSKETGKVLSCYQPRRYDAEFLAIKEWLQSGRLGKIITMRSGLYRYQRRGDWQMLRKYGGGEMSNTAAHTLDQLLLFMDEDVKLVYADLRLTVGAGDAEDHVKLLLEDASGCVGEVEVSNAAALPLPAWTVLGTTGTLTYSQRGGEMRAKWFDAEEVGEVKLVEGAAEGRRYGSGEKIPWQEETWKPKVSVPQAQAYYNDLTPAIRDGAPVVVTAESVRKQIAIMEQAREMTGLL